jgi:hypothetical protein
MISRAAGCPIQWELLITVTGGGQIRVNIIVVMLKI